MSTRLLIINFLAIVGTVIHHSTNYIIISQNYWRPEKFGVSYNYQSASGLAMLNYLRLLDAIMVAAVPLLLFVTGYIVIKIIDAQKPLLANFRISFSRVKYILIPYLIWSLFWIAFRVFQGERFSIEQVGKALFMGSAANEYYYIPILIQIYLLAPILVILVFRSSKGMLAASFVISLVSRLPFYLYRFTGIDRHAVLNFIANWHLPAYLVWFVFGMVFALKVTPAYAWIRSHRRVLNLMTLAGLALVLLEILTISRALDRIWVYSNTMISSQIFCFLLIISMLGIPFEKIAFKQRIIRFSTQSMGIYLIHGFVLMIGSKLILKFFPALLQLDLGFQFILVALAIAVPLLIINISSHSSIKRYQYIVFG